MAGKLTYQQAGVDTRKAAALVGDIGTHVRRTQQTRKLWGAFGLFAACYDLSSYKEPVMMTGCDGVGTKLELLLEHDMLETAGKDLVAMSVNDILTTGGGLPENLERLFRGMGADLEIPRWELPGIDKLLAHVDAHDRFHTFNMGIGWVAIVAEADVEAALKAGDGGTVIGRMVAEEGVRVCVSGE